MDVDSAFNDVGIGCGGRHWYVHAAATCGDAPLDLDERMSLASVERCFYPGRGQDPAGYRVRPATGRAWRSRGVYDALTTASGECDHEWRDDCQRAHEPTSR